MKMLRFVLLTLAALILAAPAFADYTVSGKFMYEDRAFTASGFTGATDFRPIRYAAVEILSGNTSLGRGAAGYDGTYSINVTGNAAQNIVARCWASSDQIPGLLMEIRTPSYPTINASGALRYFDSKAVASPGAGTVAMGTSVALSTADAGRIFNIWDVAFDAMEFVASPGVNGNFPSQKLVLLWRSDGDSRSFYWTNRLAHIAAQAGYDDIAITHQVAHFVADVFSKLDNPLDPNLTFGDATQDIRAAWAEGVAMFIGASIRKYKGFARPDLYVYTDRNGVSHSFEIESLSGTDTFASKSGSTNAIAVCAALWEITDGPDSDDATPGVDDDPLQRPFSDVWKVMTQYIANLTAPGISVESFWDGWFDPNINNGFPSEMQVIFAGVNAIEFVADAQESDDTADSAHSASTAPLAFGSGPKVVISEVNPADQAAIELFNAGDAEANLSGWTIVASRSGRVSALIELPSFTLYPGAFVIILEGSGTNRSNALYFPVTIPWGSGAEGACALRDRAGVGQDFVRWGDSREFPPGGTSFSGSNPPSPAAGVAIARNFTGGDTDAGTDWTVQDLSPGTFNAGAQERHHTFYPGGDVDYVSFDATAGHTYFIETTRLAYGADTILELLSGDLSTVVSSSDDRGPTKASRIVWTAASTGKAVVRVTRYEGPTNVARYGAYDLRIIDSRLPLLPDRPETLNVTQSGDSGTYKTISDALLAAGNGDTILITDSGSYRELLAVSNKTVTLQAAGGKKPILDGSGQSGAVLSLFNIKSAAISGLTVAGGQTGIQITSGSVAISNVLVRNGALGIVVAGGASVAIVSSVIRNQSSDGIEAISSGTTVNIVNNTIVNNGRVGVGAFDKSSVKVLNCIVRGNSSADVGGDGTATPVVKNSVVVKGGFAGKNGVIDTDPKFVSASGNDFHLLKDSPAIDKGDGADPDVPQTDADGYPRRLDGNGDGSPIPDMGAYEYLASGVLTSTAIFPQIAAGQEPDGSEYRTVIFGMNSAASPVVVNVATVRSDGIPFHLNMGSAATNSLMAVVPSNGATRIDTSTSMRTTSGYLTFASNGPLNGSALFKVVAGGKTVSEAGVGLSRLTTNFTVYIDNLNNASSGYAVANLGPRDALLTLNLRDRNGTIIDTQQVQLPAKMHIAEYANQRFPSTAPAGFEGSIEFTSNSQAVAAVALRYDNAAPPYVFSTIPVLVNEASTTLYFPQVAEGQGYTTNFILVNPNANSATATLEFYDDNGRPLALPIGGESKTSHQVSLSGRGVARFITDGTSPGLKVGWAKVTSSAPLGGSSIFQTWAGTRIISEAGVASSPLSAHFTTYVENIAYAASGLAIANPNSSDVDVVLSLRDADGNLLGSTTVSLPGYGHTAKFFTQWFPGVYSGFSGTLQVVASSPVTGVALRYDNLDLDVFATLPVVTIP